jgi:hypothetical protein
VAPAQQGERKKRIGVLISRPEKDSEGQVYVAAFQQGLEQLGWMSGRNIEIDYRWTAYRACLAACMIEETQLMPLRRLHHPVYLGVQAHEICSRCDAHLNTRASEEFRGNIRVERHNPPETKFSSSER